MGMKLAQTISTAQNYFRRYPNDKEHAQKIQNMEDIFCAKYMKSEREDDIFSEDDFAGLNYTKRWGDCLSNADHLDAFVNSPRRQFGDFYEKPSHPPYPPDFFQTMRNIGVAEKVYEYGNTYVDFGFVDLFQILWGRYQDNPFMNPLIFYGFDQSRVTTVRSKLVYGIMKIFTEYEISTSSILQIWFSSCWDDETKQAFKKVLHDAFENNENYGLVEEDLPLLRKWQKADISIISAKAEFSSNLPDSIFHPGWKMKSERDRVMYCRYLFTGCIFVDEFNITCGNPTMFTEFDGQTKMPGESFFRAIDLKVLKYPDLVSWRTDSFIETITSMTSNKTRNFRYLVNKGKIVCNFETKFIDPEDVSFAVEIQSLESHAIDWSNIPDYMESRKFIRFAALCSAEDTSHHVYFENWTHYIFGAAHVDYAEKQEECEKIYKAFKYKSQQWAEKVGTSRWSRFFQTEEYVDHVDAVNIFLTYMYGDTFEDFFLRIRLKWLRNSQSAYSFLSNQNPFAFRKSFCFNYDDGRDFVPLGLWFFMRYNYGKHDTLENFILP